MRRYLGISTFTETGVSFSDCENDYLKLKCFQTCLLRELFTFLYGCVNFVVLAVQQSRFVDGSIPQVFWLWIWTHLKLSHAWKPSLPPSLWSISES